MLKKLISTLFRRFGGHEKNPGTAVDYGHPEVNRLLSSSLNYQTSRPLVEQALADGDGTAVQALLKGALLHPHEGMRRLSLNVLRDCYDVIGSRFGLRLQTFLAVSMGNCDPAEAYGDLLVRLLA